MKINDLEFYLNRGNSFGFQANSNDGAFIGWIELKKTKANQKIMELLDESDFEYLQQLKNKENPYVLRICMVPGERINGDDYLTKADYVENRTLWFKTLAEAEAFLAGMNKNFEDIKWRADLVID